MSNEIKFERFDYVDGDILEASHMNRIEDYFEDIYSILNAKPEIYNYEPILYTSLGSAVFLTFEIKSRGDVTLTIKRGTNIVYSQKTSDKSFKILVDEKPTKAQEVKYLIEIQDSLGNTNSVEIINKIINAGLTLKNNIDTDIIIGYNENEDAILKLPDNQLIFTMEGQ